jgi:hypothetical protein
VTGFGILILLVILGPVYKIFGISFQFWIALAGCAMLIGWAYALYRKLYSISECPRCHYKTSYQRFKLAGRCPKCGKEIKV